MALVGNIRDFGLSDFLYLVDRGYKTGCLHLNHGDAVASLYFDKGKLVTASNGNGLGQVDELLIRKGKLTADQAKEARQAHQRNDDVPLSHIIVDMGFVSREDMQRLLQQYIEESVYGLFGWKEGEFRFEQNQRPANYAPIMPAPISVENLIMEGVRRIDEWGRIKDRIPSTDMVVRFIEQPFDRVKSVQLSTEEWKVFARINGKQTLAELAQKTNMSDFDVCRVVYGFVTTGLVEVVRQPRPGSTNGSRGAQDAPKIKKSLVTRIINRIRGM
jgi:hypothetical protein